MTRDAGYEIAAYTASADGVSSDKYLDRPLVPFEEIERRFPPGNFSMFVAVGYARLNKVRERFFNEAKDKGYTLISYVCSKATIWDENKIGENVFIFEDNTIQPFVTIGDNTILWSGNHIGHHSTIEPHCFITSHVVVSGYCTVGSHSFLGVNATLSDRVEIGKRNVVGPGARIRKSTSDDAAYIPGQTEKFTKSSDYFFKW